MRCHLTQASFLERPPGIPGQQINRSESTESQQAFRVPSCIFCDYLLACSPLASTRAEVLCPTLADQRQSRKKGLSQKRKRMRRRQGMWEVQRSMEGGCKGIPPRGENLVLTSQSSHHISRRFSFLPKPLEVWSCSLKGRAVLSRQFPVTLRDRGTKSAFYKQNQHSGPTLI